MQPVALEIREANPVSPWVWGALGLGALGAIVVAVARASQPVAQSVAAPGLQGPPDAVVQAQLAQHPTGRLLNLVDAIYAQQYPQCPEVIDPNEPLHEQCTQWWVLTRQKVSAIRDSMLPGNLILITDSLERKLLWPELLARQEQPLVAVIYRDDKIPERILEQMIKVASTNPDVLYVMLENSTSLSHGGDGVSGECGETDAAVVTASPSYKSNEIVFAECLTQSVVDPIIELELVTATDQARP